MIHKLIIAAAGLIIGFSVNDLIAGNNLFSSSLVTIAMLLVIIDRSMILSKKNPK